MSGESLDSWASQTRPPSHLGALARKTRSLLPLTHCPLGLSCSKLASMHAIQCIQYFG